MAVADDLHARLRAAVEARLELARAATSGPWEEEYSAETGCCVLPPDSRGCREYVARTQLYAATFDAKHIAANDPAATIRHCEADLRRLERHKPVFDDCDICRKVTCSCRTHLRYADCSEIRDTAYAYGVDITESTEEVAHG